MTEAIFHTLKDAYGSAQGETPTQWVVFRVTGIKVPKLDPNSTDSKAVAQTVQRQLTDDMIGQYLGRLESDLGTSINTSVLAQATGNSSGGPD